MSTFTSEELRNPYKEVLYRSWLTVTPGMQKHDLPYADEQGNICCLLTALSECDAAISTYQQGSNPYRWVLARLRDLGLDRYKLVKHLRENWNRVANS